MSGATGTTAQSGAPPLQGVRIVDLTALTPGPYASMMLAELGATVVKVERPGMGDPLREMLPKSFQMLNRGKFSVELDLTDDKDREILLTLCETADVFLEGFRPGVVDRLGVGFDDVNRRRPNITYLSLSSYGQAGPLSRVAGHDLNFVARAGGLFLSGFDGEVPRYGTYQIADLAASAFAVIAVLAALRAGVGQASHIDLSLLGSALAYTQLAAAEAADMHGESRAEQRPANGVFVAADGGRLTICAVEDSFWQALCSVLDMEAMARRPELATYADRTRYSEEINATVTASLQRRACADWLSALGEAGVPAAPVLTPASARTDPQVVALGLAAQGSDLAVSLPTPGLALASLGHCPRLGEHNDLVRKHGWDRLLASSTAHEKAAE